MKTITFKASIDVENEQDYITIRDVLLKAIDVVIDVNYWDEIKAVHSVEILDEKEDYDE